MGILKKIFSSIDDTTSNSNKTLNILKIENGIVKIIDQHRTMVGSFSCGDAISAEFNADQTLIVVLRKTGRVDIRQRSGTCVGGFSGEFLTAKWLGDNIAVTLKVGRTELRSKNGSLVKYL